MSEAADFVAEAAGDPRLRLLSVAELRAQERPRWLVRGVVQCQTIAMLVGATGSGKTFFAFDLAASVSRGTPWFGRRVRRGGVAYVAGEGHLRNRVDAYCQQFGIDSGDLDLLRTLSTPLNLREAGADLVPLLGELKAAAAEIGGIELVVLDTLNSMMAGGDENSSEGMGAMIAAARTIAEQLQCSVIVVHHSGKDETRGARGHSSLKAAVDTEISVRDTGTERIATIEKQRDGETGATFAFRLTQVDLGASDDPEAEPDERETSCVVEPCEAARAAPRRPKRDVALDSLIEAIAERGETMPGTSTLPAGVRAVRLPQWERRWLLRAGDDYRTPAVATAAFRRERGRLVKAGAVIVSHPWVWPA